MWFIELPREYGIPKDMQASNTSGDDKLANQALIRRMVTSINCSTEVNGNGVQCCSISGMDVWGGSALFNLTQPFNFSVFAREISIVG